MNSSGVYLANHSIHCHLDRLPPQRFQEGVWLEEELLLSCVFDWHKSANNCFHSEQTSLQYTYIKTVSLRLVFCLCNTRIQIEGKPGYWEKLLKSAPRSTEPASISKMVG